MPQRSRPNRGAQRQRKFDNFEARLRFPVRAAAHRHHALPLSIQKTHCRRRLKVFAQGDPELRGAVVVGEDVAVVVAVVLPPAEHKAPELVCRRENQNGNAILALVESPTARKAPPRAQCASTEFGASASARRIKRRNGRSAAPDLRRLMFNRFRFGLGLVVAQQPDPAFRKIECRVIGRREQLIFGRVAGIGLSYVGG